MNVQVRLTSDRVRACTFREPWFLQRCRELTLNPTDLHRKIWEFAVIAQAYVERVDTGGYVLGFGVGTERLPAYFAARSANVVATDGAENEVWTTTNQHAKSVDDLTYPNVCSLPLLRENVTFREADMNNIPNDLRQEGFDLVWSSGSFEHLGSVEAGLAFFLHSMACLKPGGIAVHTTEFNDGNGATLEEKDIVLFQRRHINELGHRLAEQGDMLLPLDDKPGIEDADVHVDRAPWSLPHLSIELGGFVSTSIVLIAERGGWV